MSLILLYNAIQKCTGADFALWTIVPVERNGFSLQGETNKWVSVSEARFADITTLTVQGSLAHDGSGGSSTGLEVRLRGMAGEAVTIGFVSPQGDAYSVTCTFRAEEGSQSPAAAIEHKHDG